MRKLGTLMSVVSLLLAPAVAAKTAFAHGGQYRGPAGEVPPDSRQPQDPPPPDTGGGTPTPPDTGGGTPTPPDQGGGTPTPPDSGGTPDQPDSGGDTPSGPTGPSSGVKSSGGKTGKKGPSYESWLFWWNYNKDEILNIKRALRAGSARSSGDLGEVAQGGSENFSEEQNITAKAIESRVVPLLKLYAENSKVNFDVQASGVLGLAKIGRRESTPLLMKMAENSSSNSNEQYHKVVQETAALALGVMQHRSPEVRKFLSQLATNGAAPVRSRCFSAFALGLLGDQDAGPGANAETLTILKSLVASNNEASKEIASSALIGIGLIGDRSMVPELLTWLREEKAGTNKLSDIQLSYVAAALGKIGQPGFAGPDSHEVVDALRAQLLQKNRMTRYSSVIALGQIAPNADEKVQKECVSILSEVVKNDGKANSDTQTVNFALTALGRIAGVAPGADGKGGCPQAVRERVLKVLGEAFEGKTSNRSFAALGLGLAAMHQNESVKTPIADKILDALTRSSGDVEARGALVISLGLLKNIQSAKVLQDLLQDKGTDKKLRGTAAVALGLIGDKTAIEVVRKTLMEREDRELRVDAAIAAGLLKDSEAVKVLVEILQDPKSSQFVLGSVATALGQIGDQRAVEPLAGILNDEKAPDLTRALACVALGQIGDKNDLSVLSRVSKDVNYRAYYDAIGELLTIL